MNVERTIYKGITPTITLTLPKSIDLNGAEVYVTFAPCRGESFTKTNEELDIDGNTIYVYLTQEETLSFPTGKTAVQVNWTYMDSGVKKRACTQIAKFVFEDNLLNEVL